MRRIRSMGLLALLGAAALPVAVLGASPGPGAGEPGSASILVEDFAFTPAEVEILAGASVTWTIGADPEQHTVTPADGSSFEDSGQLFQGDTYVVRFDAPGAYAYLCTLHPFMTGTVTVAAPAPSAAVTPTPSAPPSAPPSLAPASVGPSPAPAASPPAADPVGASTDVLPVVAVVLAAAAAAGAVGGIALWRRRPG